MPNDRPNDPREVLTRPAPPPDRVLTYGHHRDHVADLRLPTGTAPAPLVVVIHGGFWRQAFDRSHAGPQSRALADAGYAVATIEYRRVGGGGGVPATFDDVATAVDRVPELAAATGRVDAGRVALVGHSAGGHLALWAALRHRLPPTSPWRRDRDMALRGVVALAGVVDLGAARAAGLGEDAVDALVGGHDLADVDPALLPASELPVVLVHGRDDDRVPVANARGYADRRPAVQLWELEGVEHFGPIDPLSTAWPHVLKAVEIVMGAATTIGSRADR